MKEKIKRAFLSLEKADKEDVIKFIIRNLPRGRKLKDIMKIPHDASAFDLDLVDGQISEMAFLNIATSGKHEIKRDFEVSRTGNIAVEVSRDGKPTALAITEAPYWVYWLTGNEYQDEIAIIVTVARLRKLVALFPGEVKGGDGDRTKMHLVPVSKLLMPNSEIERLSSEKESGITRGPTCPKCGAGMRLKQFWGCTKFPGCRGSRPCHQ